MVDNGSIPVCFLLCLHVQGVGRILAVGDFSGDVAEMIERQEDEGAGRRRGVRPGREGNYPDRDVRQLARREQVRQLGAHGGRIGDRTPEHRFVENGQ